VHALEELDDPTDEELDDDELNDDDNELPIIVYISV
jgi:hypothetical protein